MSTLRIVAALAACLGVSACRAAHKDLEPTVVRVVETQRVEIPVAVPRRPPAELAAPYAPPALPVFVSPADPAASSALTPDGERELRAVLSDLLARIAAWRAWADEDEKGPPDEDPTGRGER